MRQKGARGVLWRPVDHLPHRAALDDDAVACKAHLRRHERQGHMVFGQSEDHARHPDQTWRTRTREGPSKARRGSELPQG